MAKEIRSAWIHRPMKKLLHNSPVSILSSEKPRVGLKPLAG
jgi:hypothetical protein